MVATFSYLLAWLALGATAAEHRVASSRMRLLLALRRTGGPNTSTGSNSLRNSRNTSSRLGYGIKLWRLPILTEPTPSGRNCHRAAARVKYEVGWVPELRLLKDCQLLDILGFNFGTVSSAITSCLTEKKWNLNSPVRIAIDNWALGKPAPQSNAIQLGCGSGKPFAKAGASEKLDAIVTTVQRDEEFSRLMTVLVSPPVEDSLPTPETCGSSTHLSGIDLYIDYITGTIFINPSL
ncbi:hypothetical protein HOY82DRAFT_611868 [Tuber indicum]|nr:hypothetical protein HOY82DRAFT_611868 [Tuber indicum]